MNRVSKEEQKLGYSLDTQLQKCRLFCEQLEADVVHLISEDYSATRSSSLFAGLEPMFAAVEAGEVDFVIFFELDRVTRGGLGETTVIVDRIKKAGVSVGYAARMAMSGVTPDEIMMDGLRALFAQREWQVTRERTMRGWKGKAEKGIFIGNGIPPYGYDRLVDPVRNKTSGLAINEERATVVRSIFRWFVYGEDGPALGVKEIAERLRIDEVPTPGMHRTGYARKRGYFEWSPTTIYDILRHSAYRGIAYAFKSKFTGMGNTKKSHLSQQRPEEEWIPTFVPVIVEEALWQAAQVKLNEGKARSIRNTKYGDAYLLGRRIRCSCGYAIHGSSHTWKAQNGNTSVWVYYRCSAKIPGHVAGTCDLPNIRTERVDTAVWAWLQRRLITPEEVTENEERRAARQHTSTEHFDQRILAYAAELDKLTEEAGRVNWQHRKQLITDVEFAQQRAEINDERAAKQAAIDRLEQQRLSARQREQQRVAVSQLAGHYRELAAVADTARRRGVLDALDVNVVLYEGAAGTLGAEVYSVFEFDPERDKLVIPIK